MARSFDATYASAARVEQVLAAFGDRDYWDARIAAYDPGIVVESLTVDTDGAVDVHTVQDLARDALPGPLARLYPRDLVVHRTERWTPRGPQRVAGEVGVTTHGAPVSGSGAALLTATADGSQMAFSATVTVRIPVVGGGLEKLFAGQLADGLGDLHRFTTAWIADHG